MLRSEVSVGDFYARVVRQTFPCFLGCLCEVPVEEAVLRPPGKI